MGAAPRNQPGRRAAAAPSAPGSTLGVSVGNLCSGGDHDAGDPVASAAENVLDDDLLPLR